MLGADLPLRSIPLVALLAGLALATTAVAKPAARPAAKRAPATATGKASTASPAPAHPAPARPPVAKRTHVRPDDLASVFTDGPVARALDLIGHDDWGAARAALLETARDGKSPEHLDRIRFLLGLACVKSSDWMGALAVLDGLETTAPAVTDRIRYLRGLALAGLGRNDDALADLAATSRSHTPVGTAAALARADLLAGMDRPADAAKAYGDAVAAGRRDPETLSHLAAALKAAGRSEEAAAVLRKAYFEAAASGRALYRKILESLGVRLVATARETLDHAHALLDAQMSEAALAEARGLTSDKDPDLRCDALMVAGGALTKLRRHPEALAVYQDAADCGSHADLARVFFNAARAAYRSSKPEDGDRWVARLAREFPASTLNDDLSVMHARNLLGRGDEAGAVAVLQASLAAWPDGDMANESRWVIAWIAFRARHYETALARMGDGALAAVDEPQYAQRFCYWTARTLELLERADEADDAYGACVRDHPVTFYGTLALSRLGALRKASPAALATKAAEDAPDAPGPWLSIADAGLLRRAPFDRALWLLRTGLPELAAEEVAGAAEGGAGDDAWLAAAILDAGGQFTRSHRAASTLLRKGPRFWPDADTAGYWRVAYPRPFADLVRAASQESGVDPALIWAVMREESAFVAGVESRANAIGLMQLILPTAKAVAARLKLDATPETLRTPAVNIRLGAGYLAELLKQLHDPLLAIPGYNAGGGAISKWRAAHPKAPLDEFVEEIGAQESRDYARKVFESLVAYRLLYAEGPDRFVTVRFLGAEKAQKADAPKKKAGKGKSKKGRKHG